VKKEPENYSPSRRSYISPENTSSDFFSIYSLGKIEIAIKIINKVIKTLETIDKLPSTDIEKKLNALYLSFIFDAEFDLVIFNRVQ